MVSKFPTVLKRLVLGRPFRSDRLSHTLLPKRIALPIFASDALSSVAYAPEEIFLTLSVAGSGRDQVMARFPRTGGQPVGPVLPAKAVPTSVGFDRPLDRMRSLLQDIGTKRRNLKPRCME